METRMLAGATSVGALICGMFVGSAPAAAESESGAQPTAAASAPSSNPPPPVSPEASLSLRPAASGEQKEEDESGGDAELSKKLSNPISNLISVPFQFNYDKGFGPKNAERVTLNIQPVIPFSISEDWNLILRTIVPVIYQDSIANGIDSQTAIGDTTQSFFFSPKEPIGGWIIGAGPVALWPTGTDPMLRAERWGAGPTVVALRQDKGWTIGILANHIWSYTSSDDHPYVSSTFLQPFISYTFPTATSITLNTESTYDWNARQWTVPINLVAGQVLRFGKQPVQFTFGGRYYADKPSDGPEWGLRFVVTLLFPK